MEKKIPDEVMRFAKLHSCNTASLIEEIKDKKVYSFSFIDRKGAVFPMGMPILAEYKNNKCIEYSTEEAFKILDLLGDE